MTSPVCWWVTWCAEEETALDVTFIFCCNSVQVVHLYLNGLSEAALAKNFPIYEVGGTEDAFHFVHWIDTQRFGAINVSSVRE